jgi:hypothetical protein
VATLKSDDSLSQIGEDDAFNASRDRAGVVSVIGGTVQFATRGSDDSSVRN